MEPAAKIKPEKDEIRLFEQEFPTDRAEGLLEKSHLDSKNTEELSEIFREMDGELVSVHIPHIDPDQLDAAEEMDYAYKTQEIASELDAIPVFHSKYVHNSEPEEFDQWAQEWSERFGEEPEWLEDMAFEHQAGETLSQGYEHHVKRKGRRGIVLDVAHLYNAVPGEVFYGHLESLLQSEIGDSVELIHVAGSDRVNDSLPIEAEENEIDYERVYSNLEENYEGPIVMETPWPEGQMRGIEYWKELDRNSGAVQQQEYAFAEGRED